ncbi:zinc finger protein 518A isoform X2 [Festucalex cinctus]
MDEDLKLPPSSAINYSASSVKDAKDMPPFKERARLSQGNQDCPPVKKRISSKRAHCKIQQGAVFSGNILSFGCSVCKDASTFSPNDLLKHFRGAHKGVLPTYPCDLCGFVTNEFAALQRHRIGHKNTLVTCELCTDGIQYSLLLLTRHYIMCHSLNGKFHCDWCEFTTVDAGTFVQHIHHHNESPWKCSSCRHISLNEVDHQKHLKAHTISLPLICQICGYCATNITQLKTHTVAAHKTDQHPYNQQVRPNLWKRLEPGAARTNYSPSCQSRLKNISELQDTQKLPNGFSISGILPNQNGRMKSEMCSEEVRQTVDGSPTKKDYANRNSLTAEQSSPVMLLDNDSCGSPTNPNTLKVLMVKNKISLPPNCTTKVMGFKMVDGKKHLVLKVIPVAKQNKCPPDNASVDDLDSSAARSTFFKNEVHVENEESSAHKSPTPHFFAVPPGSGSCIQKEDVMAVKVKIEEEETSVFTLESPLHRDDLGRKCDHSVNGSSTEETNPVTNTLDPVDRQNSPGQTACSETNLFDSKSVLENSETLAKFVAKASNVVPITFNDYSLNVSREELQSKSTCENNVENCRVDEKITCSRKVNIFDEHKETPSGNSTENSDQFSQSTLESTESTRAGIRHLNDDQNCPKNVENFDSPAEITSITSFRENDLAAQSSLNHKVFTFHNYSKEAFGLSPSVCEQNDGMPELTSSIEMKGNLTLDVSSKPFEDGDCADSDDENPESVLKDFNVIKIEEELIPVTKNLSDKNSTSSALGSFVEQHSDEIITQQLHKERNESLHTNDCSKQTETTVQLVQVQNEKQQVVLKTEKTMPMQVKPTPSFRLITNCINPQINVSSMKSGFETSSNPTGETGPPKDKNIGTSKAGGNDKIATLVSSLQSGVSASPHHFLINSPNLKGPVLLSTGSHNNPTDKVAKKQPTCYLLPRSIPFVQAPNTSGLKQASAKLPVNSRPVLAMPVSSAHKPSNLQTGRQTFLLRYISPPKSSVLLNNLEMKPTTQSCHTIEKRGNKVVFKIVSPTRSLLKSGSPSSTCQPLLLATSPPTQCFLMSSNANASNNLKKIITRQNEAQSAVMDSTPQLTPKRKPSEADKPQLAPRPIRPPSRRKLSRKALFDELPTTVHKARRLTNKVQTEKDTTVLWSPIAKEVERSLRLAPYNCLQEIKCPRRYQPVVVLNHPDADIPEVANIMKVINRHKGAVSKVSLSQKTIKALTELGTLGGEIDLTEGGLMQSNEPSPRAVQSLVRERFLLKLKLRKKAKRKYEVVQPLLGSRQKTVFNCWFCGRLFNSQEHWIGHGQRHLMEATRDWNKLL